MGPAISLWFYLVLRCLFSTEVNSVITSGSDNFTNKTLVAVVRINSHVRVACLQLGRQLRCRRIRWLGVAEGGGWRPAATPSAPPSSRFPPSTPLQLHGYLFVVRDGRFPEWVPNANNYNLTRLRRYESVNKFWFMRSGQKRSHWCSVSLPPLM